ncbi:MAG: efflux RND transporter permease subunit, partial [Rhodospirillaceae bacterium]|nr:efflux RND transporter permease subunit [Rhodospirillaceae bacterium]
MNLIRSAIDRPIAVIAAVLMIVMFGLLALQTIPIQLTPDIRKPVLSVRTSWPGAAPAEIEREVINRQEDVLKGLEGLDSMSSRSGQGSGNITLEFSLEQDMDKALVLVSNRLERITGYPDEVDKPTLRTHDSEDRPIAWFTLKRLPGNERDIHTYGDFIENVVQDRIERVQGIAGLNVYGGMKREMRVLVDPERMARFGLTVPAVVNAIRAANSSATAGTVDEGKRRYVVRTEGELSSIEQVSGVVVRSISDSASGQISRVTIGDIGKIVYGYREPTSRIRRLGEQTLIMNAVGDAGKNVIVTMSGVHKAVEELNSGPLKTEGLELIQMYDETIYINSAIDLVQQNIWLGGFLAAIVLLLFLRSGAATIIISVAIPVSVIGAFVAMAAMGRSINVISLAGIAFAVGMVVDAAIVVLENIYRLRQEGSSASEAAYNGAKQVWGAVLVSALTTVLVFAPILAMNLEVGQLFRDIAVAISVAVVLSLVVAITVIPALSNRLLQKIPEAAKIERLQSLDAWAGKFTNTIVSFTHRIAHDKKLALRVVVGITVSAAVVTWTLLPKLEYLPEGNRNLIIGAILPPPGYNLQTTISIAEEVEAEVKKYWASETGPDEAADGTPKIDNFFFVARPTSTFVGASAIDPDRAAELIPIIRKPVFKEPGTFGFVTQPSLFGRSVGSGRSIDIDISGPELEEVLSMAIKVTQLTGKALP